SQFAYAAGKKTTPATLEAFRKLYGTVPDAIILFTVPEEYISITLERARARRGETHQIGKEWNDVQDQMNIQNAYIQNFTGQNNVYVVDVESGMDIDDVFIQVKFIIDYLLE